MVGILAAAESLLGMLRNANGPEASAWGMVTVAAAVLLAVDGLGQFAAAIPRGLLVALAAVVPVGISLGSEESLPGIWMFALAMGFLEWMFLELRVKTGRTEIGGLVCGMALAVSLANTTLMLFRMYWNEPQFWPLGQIFRFMLPIALPWTLVVILLVHSGREVAGGLRTEASAGAEGTAKVGADSAD